MGDFIRDETAEPFTMIPNWIFDSELSAMERMAWIVIKTFAWGNKDSAFPSVATIADMMGVASKRTVHNAIDGCIKKGYLSKEARCEGDVHGTNVYTLKKPSQGGSAKSALGVVQNLHGGSAKSAPEAYKTNRKEIIKSSDDLILQSDLRSKDSSALDEELSDEAKVHRAYFGAFARSLTALEATSLEDYPVENVLNAIEKAKAHTPKRPARYVKTLLDSIITVPDHLKQHYNVWRACAFTTAPTKTPPPYDPSQDDVTRLERLKGMCSYDELFQFLTEKKQDAFWQDKVIALKFVQDNINTWKGAR